MEGHRRLPLRKGRCPRRFRAAAFPGDDPCCAGHAGRPGCAAVVPAAMAGAPSAMAAQMDAQWEALDPPARPMCTLAAPGATWAMSGYFVLLAGVPANRPAARAKPAVVPGARREYARCAVPAFRRRSALRESHRPATGR